MRLGVYSLQGLIAGSGCSVREGAHYVFTNWPTQNSHWGYDRFDGIVHAFGQVLVLAEEVAHRHTNLCGAASRWCGCGGGPR